MQVHTAAANAECVRMHGGIVAMLTRPPLPARIFQIFFQASGVGGWVDGGLASGGVLSGRGWVGCLGRWRAARWAD